MPGFVPTDEQRDCNRSPPTQVPLRFAVLPEATAVPRWHRSLCLIPIIGRANCGLLILGVQSRSELDRIVFESIGFFCPGFTDGFERRQPIQSLETLGEVVGVEECLDVLAKLVVAVVVVAPNSRLFESTVHPLDLPAHFSDIDVEVADRVPLEPFLRPVSPSIAGSLLISWRWNSRCSDDRVRCGMVAWRA